jgi:tRNA nucleotidyltransferase/poly(A) polymerase
MHIPKDISIIHEAYTKAGKKLYVVGGAVRDTLLGVTPKDYDLATDALPDETLRIVKSIGSFTTLEIGAAFGVIVARSSEGEEYEIATFRKDDTAGRRPDSVTFTTIEGDVKRRDFTINALFYDLEAKSIVDLVGGVEDIKQRVVRTVGNPTDRFYEDKLRVLRAVRFAERLGGEIEKATREAIVADSNISSVSPERIRAEFVKIIDTAQDIAHAMQELSDLNLLEYIFPGCTVELSGSKVQSILGQIALLLKNEDAESLKKKLNKLKYSRSEIACISFLVDIQHLSPTTANRLKVAHQKLPGHNMFLKQTTRLMGLSKTSCDAFFEFVAGQPRVSATRLMELGWTGRNLGAKLRINEQAEFVRILAIHEGKK